VDMTDLKKKMIVTIGILFVVFVVGGIIYYAINSAVIDSLPFIGGALLGAAVSVGKVIMLAYVVDKSLTKDEKAAGNYIRLNHLLRLALTGAALLLAGLAVRFLDWDASILWGTAAGVLSYQAAVYTLKFSTKKEGGEVKPLAGNVPNDSLDANTASDPQLGDTKTNDFVAVNASGNINDFVAVNANGNINDFVAVNASGNTNGDAERLTIQDESLAKLKEQLKQELREEIRAALEAELKEGVSESEKPKEET